MNGGAGPNSTLITLAIVLIVVVRFLMRELRARTVRARSIWIRPIVLGVLLALFIALSAVVPGINLAVLGGSILIGAAVGVVTGALVGGSTTFSPAAEPKAVVARGNAVTVAVWVIALALRFAVRYAFAGLSADTAAQFELNVGLVALVFAAFLVVAIAFRRAIDRVGGAVAA